MTNIGYLAVDLTLDKELGPVLLEVNARAGLMVQVANLAPLKSRLQRVGGLKVSSPEKGVRIAEELFGEKVSRKNAVVSDKPIISSREIIEITGEGFTLEEPAGISPEREETVFAPDLIEELRKRKALEPVNGSLDTFRMKFSLQDKKIQTIVRAASIALPETRVLIGRRDLAGFLIDPSKRSVGVQAAVRSDLRAADRILADLDKGLQLLRELRPLNLEEELKILRSDQSYNPVFLLRQSTTDLDEAEVFLKKVATDDSPLGILLKKKRRELLMKVELLRARGDAERFTAASLSLYGTPSAALIGFAKAHLSTRKACDLKREGDIPAKKAKEAFEKTLVSYGLHEWQVIIKKEMVSDCAVGGRKIFLRENAHFTKEHIDSLIAHEIETHVITSENGDAQPYKIFRRGFANYLDTQEGLAVYNQIRVLSPYHEKCYQHAKNVLGIAYAMEHSFAELRNYLQEELGFKPDKALMKAIDFKRGISRTAESGAFTRGLVYFRGFRAIEQYVKGGGDLKKLYTGKLAIEDLSIVEKIEGLLPPLILPVWMHPSVPKAAKKTSGSKKKS